VRPHVRPRQTLAADFVALAAAGDRIATPKLLVVGDVILDRYAWGNAERVSPEAPVVVLRADDDEIRLGGAASVAYLLRGLGAQVTLAGVIGDDANGRLVRRLLSENNITDALVVDPTRPTTSKERVMGRAPGRQPHQIVRVDREDSRPLDIDVAERLADAVPEALRACGALLISDYAKGVCTPELLAEIFTVAAAAALPVIVDPARVPDFSRYAGATLVKPNRAEAELAAAMPLRSPDDAMLAAQKLRALTQAGAVLVTLDAEGMVLAGPDGITEHFPTLRRTVFDITGAGDMVLAVLGLGYAAGLPLAETIRLANVAAGLEVEKVGVAQVSRDELKAAVRESLGPGATVRRTYLKLTTLDELAELVAGHRTAGQRVAFTNGCFDLLHVGHVTYLEQAAELADILIVAVNCDSSVRRLKGAGRPVVCERDRATMLAALECVDHVVVFDDDTPVELLRRLRPDVLVKGGTYSLDQVVGREIVEGYGGCVRVVGAVPGISTTALIRQAAGRCQT
jgi:D-beta-D-heptose 7-phosphate kinase/D-beta-D-heptose 1-phosphate adenosyltransferase